MPSEDSSGTDLVRQVLHQLAKFEVSESSVPLSREVRQTSSPVKEQIALREEIVRRRLSYGIALMFGVMNIITIGVICWLASVDQGNLRHKLIPVGGRVIDTGVIMSLLGATTVQLGTIAVIMARSVFRGPD